MKNKKRNLYTLLTKWMLSYVLVSVTAIFVIFVCSKHYNNVLREDLEYTNAVQLELVQYQIDRKVNSLRAFANRTNMNRTVQNLRKADSYREISSYELYELVQQLEKEQLLDLDMDNCYLYFPNIDFLVSGHYYNDSRSFYDIAFDSYGFSYEEWYDVIHENYRTAQIFSLDTKDGKNLTIMIKPLDSSGRQTPPVNAIVIFDINEILKSSGWINKDRDQMFIIDQVNHRLVSNAPMEEEKQNQIIKLTEEHNQNSAVKKESLDFSVMSSISSGYEKWDYVVITQESATAVQISELQKLVVSLVICYLGISAGVIGYAVVHHYRPLKNAMDTLWQDSGSTMDLDENAYEYINKSIRKLVNQNQENANVIEKQKNAISRELLHRLVKEKQAYSMISEELLKQYGIEIHGKNICIAAYRMEMESDENRIDALEMSWFILQNVTEENLKKENLKHLYFREGKTDGLFLVWLEKNGEENLKELTERAIRNSAEFVHLYFKFQYRMALSEIHPGVEGLYQSYQEISRVFEYQKSEEGKDIICYGNINLLPIDTLLTYPIDVENRLIHFIRNGNEKEADQEIESLLKENQISGLAPEITQFLINSIVTSIMRAIGKNSQKTEFSETQKGLMEACQQGNVQRIQDDLEKLVQTVCRGITEQNEKKKENQKGKMYMEAKAYVQLHYSDPDLSVNSMADCLGVQSAYLSKIFKEMEDMKLSQYIHMVRLSHVRNMLEKGERLEQIAIKCGFGSQRTFLRIFKQYEGITPTQYREMKEKEETNA